MLLLKDKKLLHTLAGLLQDNRLCSRQSIFGNNEPEKTGSKKQEIQAKEIANEKQPTSKVVIIRKRKHLTLLSKYNFEQ